MRAKILRSESEPADETRIMIDEDVAVEREAKTSESASFPALMMVQNEQKFYFATMPVEDIFPYCFVATREEDPIQGFQRNLSRERAEDIALYLDGSKGSIPTNIVLSAQKEAGLHYVSRLKSIRYKRVKRAFLVLDGQHRLYGYSFTKKHHRVPVAIYEGLTRQQEAALFIDINTSQRGVPASLLLDIKQVAEQESVREQILRRHFDRLGSDARSPLNGLLSPTKSVSGRIARPTFNRAAGPILALTLMSRLDEDKQYLLLRNFFSAVERSLRKSALLRKSAYFEAFCEIFEEVARLSRLQYGDYKLDSLTNVLAPVRNVDLENLLTGGRTKVTKSAIVPVLKQTIADNIDVTEDMI